MIHLFWATCRPEMMKETLSKWTKNAVNKDSFSVHVVVDSKEDAEILEEFEPMVVDNPKGGVVTPIYELAKDFEGEENDIMIVPSDDFYAPVNWDTYLTETMADFRGVLKVNDGHMQDIISIPILGYKAFLEMNRVIYHPAYNHMFCDKELHDTANELGICRSLDFTHPEWVHRHPHFGTRNSDVYDQNNNLDYKVGKEIYTKRRYLDLAERLKV